MAADDPLVLTDRGARIVKRGGDDSVDEDGQIILEILKRAPGMSKDDVKACFIAIRTEYGGDALKAIQSGHVAFKPRKPQ